MACGCTSPSPLPPPGHTQDGVGGGFANGGQNGEPSSNNIWDVLPRRAAGEQSLIPVCREGKPRPRAEGTDPPHPSLCHPLGSSMKGPLVWVKPLIPAQPPSPGRLPDPSLAYSQHQLEFPMITCVHARSHTPTHTRSQGKKVTQLGIVRAHVGLRPELVIF